MHDGLVREVGVGHDAFGHAQLANQLLEPVLRMYNNAIRVERSGQFGRVNAIRNVGNLLRRKCHNLVCRVSAIYEVEVVEVSACGAKYERLYSAHKYSHLRR